MPICPRCKSVLLNNSRGISQRDQKSHICSKCMKDESNFDYQMIKVRRCSIGPKAKKEIQKLIEKEKSWIKKK